MINKKAIILAGGSGTRLYPSTHVVSKQLLPIYNKPMIYYSLSTAMLAGCRDVLIITTDQDQPLFQKLLGSGEQWGIKLSYLRQDKPRGIADAFLVAEDFIQSQPVFLILGDNLIFGLGLAKLLQSVDFQQTGATVFAFKVKDPKRYGVVNFDKNGKAKDIIEKPQQSSSSYAVSGLYFYDHQVVDMAKTLKPSAREELEITDLNCMYLQQQQLNVKRFSRGVAWLDTGTVDSLLTAAQFVQVLEQRQGLYIGCPEEVAWRQSYINDRQLKDLAQPLLKSGYGKYLLGLLDESY